MTANTTTAKFRTDIQGLRAVAVVLVVLNHAFDWPAGGFVGVDVFYVISGFLITGLLIREYDATGSISLRAFYARRIRRIVPVALVVLVVTVVAAFTFWYFPRAIQVALDSLSAAFFVSNWHFMAVGADYLQADGPVSPVQHYWSLSIEEQFYAVWPLLLLALFAVLKTRRELTIVVLFALVGTVGVAAYLTSADPTPAYFNTFARVWELLVGALLAIIGTAGARVPVALRQLVSIVGLIAIVGSAVIVKSTWDVPFPWVAPAVVGAGLVIWAEAPARRWGLLENPVAQWLGKISYSLYLWHFPVLIFGVSLVGDSIGAMIFLIVVMLLLSELSYRFVEKQVLTSRFLRRASKIKNARRFTVRDVSVGVVALVAIVVLSGAQLHGPGSLRSGATFTARFLAPQPFEAPDPAAGLAERVSQVERAAAARFWPGEVSSELNWLDASQQSMAMRTTAPGCRNNPWAPGPPDLVCDIAQGDHGTAMVVGDSVALSWSPTVAYVAKERDWDLTAVGYANCSLIAADARDRADTPGFAKQCAERQEAMFDMVDDTQPDVLFLSASETVIEYLDLPVDEAVAAWQAGIERTLDRLSAVDEVYVLTNPPRTDDPLECANRLVGPASCASSATEHFAAKKAAEIAAVVDYPNATVIDTESWFCTDDVCPAYVDEHVVRTDTSHLTKSAAQAVGPVLLEAIS